MSEKYKGLPEAYDQILGLFDEQSTFYEWILKPSQEFEQGQLCTAVIQYVKRKKWYLVEHNYDEFNEAASTWYVCELKNRMAKSEPSGFVKKYFDLALDENFIVSNCKVRPVILVNKVNNDWWNPLITSDHIESWLCIPIFSYKQRHNQKFVLNDQCLNSKDRFYIPPFYKDKPGLKNESAAIFNALQSIPSFNLKRITAPCSLAESRCKPFKLSKLALKLLLYHMYIKNTDIFNAFDEVDDSYSCFKDLVHDFFVQHLSENSNV